MPRIKYYKLTPQKSKELAQILDFKLQSHFDYGFESGFSYGFKKGLKEGLKLLAYLLALAN